MAQNNFASALTAVLAHEGGWSDHPSDPGGATMRGVTLATYRRYKPGATKEQLRNITEAELQRIYREGYWNMVRADDLPAGLDYALFDFAVNSGPAKAAITLQTIVGAATDGVVGPLTLKAVADYSGKFGVAQLISELCSHRLAFLERLSTWPVFGKGWRNRVAGVRELATQMAAAAPGIPTVPLPQPKPGGIPGWVIVLVLIALALAGAFFFVRF